MSVKVLFHKLHPDNKVFNAFLEHKNIMPRFWIELSEKEYLMICFQYSRQPPLSISKPQQKRYGIMLYDYFTKSGKHVGDVVDDLTIQMFHMGRPPAIYNIGGVSVRWTVEKHFSIDIGN